MAALKIASAAIAALMLAVAAARRREWRGGLLFVACVILAGGAQECEPFLKPLFPGLREPETPLTVAFLVLGFALALVNRGSTRAGLSAIWKNRRFPLLVWGVLLVSLLPNLAKAKFLWKAFASLEAGTHDVREAAESTVETMGCFLLLNWAVLFLRDKWRLFGRRVSPLNRLLSENELVEVGRGTRRVCYRVGDTGYCAKFYRPREECTEAAKMQKSIRRDIGWRRFNKRRNVSCEEVYVYNALRHSMPEEIRRRMPETCERVFHPEWGWGVIETYCTNPDGTAVIPYEFEIARQPPEVREVIYAQARDLLDKLISAGALFYEPGNLHVQFGADGSVELRIVDFEPSSKTAIPLEHVWPWYRRRKLARKARRYLAHICAKYGVRGKSLRWLAAERAFGVDFASFERVAAGNSSRNYRAATESGASYLVKFAPPAAVAAVVRRLSAVRAPSVPGIAFGGRTGSFRDEAVCAVEWRGGCRSVDPAQLVPGQIDALLSAYSGFSAALQGAAADLPRRDDLGEFDFGMEPVAIHGDMHCRNVLFGGGGDVSFVDLETARIGYPTEDLLRVFMHAAERTRFWRLRRLAAIVRNFGELVRRSPYPAKAWTAAVDLYRRRKGVRRSLKSRFPAAKRVKELLLAPYYRWFRSVAAKAKEASR